MSNNRVLLCIVHPRCMIYPIPWYMPRYIPIDLPKPEDQTKKYEQQPPGLIQKEPTATSASRKSMFSTRPPGSHRRRPSQDRWETQIVKYGWLVTSKFKYIYIYWWKWSILPYSYHYFLGGVGTWNQLFGYFATRTLNWRSGKTPDPSIGSRWSPGIQSIHVPARLGRSHWL
jgi:hypothetical protein